MTFRSEQELCTRFAAIAEAAGWDVWPEVEGWDLVLVATSATITKQMRIPEGARRRASYARVPVGTQVGVEAKLAPSIQQLHQGWSRLRGVVRPDAALLVVAHVRAHRSRRSGIPAHTLWGDIARASGLRLVGVCSEHGEVPNLALDPSPARLPLPPVKARLCDAGTPNPRAVTTWRIKALRLIIEGRSRGFVTRDDFAKLDLHMGRWVTRKWLLADGTHGRFTRYRLNETAPDFPAHGWKEEIESLRLAQ